MSPSSAVYDRDFLYTINISNNGLPTDYSQDEWHPELLSDAEVIALLEARNGPSAAVGGAF